MQRCLTEELSGAVEKTAFFAQRYESDFDLVFYLSAKRATTAPEIKGPSISKRYETVEYSIFLPFDVISSAAEALRYLLQGVREVFVELNIGTGRLDARADAIVERVCSQPEMFTEPWLNA
jgi:hypothetical protein